MQTARAASPRPGPAPARSLLRLVALALCFAAGADCLAQQRAAVTFAGSLYASPQPQATPEEEEDDIKPSRPSVANPAEFQKPGVLQFEYGYDANFRAEDVRLEQTVPLTLRYAATKRLLLEVDFDALKSETDEETRTRVTSIGDTRLGFQVVALEETEGCAALAFAYYVKLPTADEEKGLGSGRFDHRLVTLISKKVGETDVDFNAAYLLVGREGAAGWLHGGQGALDLTRDVGERFALEGELSGQSVDDVLPRGLFALGALHYKASRRLIFDAGARFGLNPAAPRVGLFAGATVGLTRPRGR